ncbi:MAG: lysophospholipid acyltransferase family protein [Bacilli bacterium]|nr:lysophospholipid acyltransferase family protein [Bacilli bacterium]MDD4795740.1 lysophospholipid acyltransferase family protein [Bacilli bacterium]
MIAFDREIKSAYKLDEMTVKEKHEYYEDLKEYILSLPFDKEKLNIGEKKFLKTVDFAFPKVEKYYKPNFSSKLTEIPDQFILISNHLCSFDQVLLSYAFPDTAFHYMIAESLMEAKNLYVGKFYVNRGAFVVDRTTHEGRILAIPKALQYLYQGAHVAMFPEASRQIRYGSDGTVQKFKNGSVILSQMSNVPIIPVAINNNYKKGESYINVGEKFEVGLESSIVQKNIELREKVIELWKENHDKGAKILTKKR